jgi:hypothetical protein
MIKYESNKKADVFCHFSNNIGFPMQGTLSTINPFCDAPVAKSTVM